MLHLLPLPCCLVQFGNFQAQLQTLCWLFYFWSLLPRCAWFATCFTCLFFLRLVITLECTVKAEHVFLTSACFVLFPIIISMYPSLSLLSANVDLCSVLLPHSLCFAVYIHLLLHVASIPCVSPLLKCALPFTFQLRYVLLQSLWSLLHVLPTPSLAIQGQNFQWCFDPVLVPFSSPRWYFFIFTVNVAVVSLYLSVLQTILLAFLTFPAGWMRADFKWVTADVL